MNRRLITGLLFIALFIAFSSLGGCTFVPLDPGAADVSVLRAKGAEGCERIGSTHVKVLAKVMGISRSQEKMSSQLDNLARNAATEMGGNGVGPEGPISDGKRRYTVYRCPSR